MYTISKNRNIFQPASYSIIMATIALMILGLALSPLLKVKLLPDRSLPSVYYNYNGANAVVVDSEVTSPLEAKYILKRILQSIRSAKMIFSHKL